MNIQSIFQYKNWDNFQHEAPFLAGPWNMRNLKITGWYVKNNMLQIAFTVDHPVFEQFAWEMPVKKEEYSKIRTWMKSHIPDIWKNLLLEEKDGSFENNSGSELRSLGSF